MLVHFLFDKDKNFDKISKMKLKLVYFNARGRGELARLIAAYGKLDFEDVRVDFHEWSSLKPSK